MFYPTRGEHVDHYTTDAAHSIYVLMLHNENCIYTPFPFHYPCEGQNDIRACNEQGNEFEYNFVDIWIL